MIEPQKVSLNFFYSFNFEFLFITTKQKILHKWFYKENEMELEFFLPIYWFEYELNLRGKKGGGFTYIFKLLY